MIYNKMSKEELQKVMLNTLEESAQNGELYVCDNVEYDDKESLIATGILGWCGCGMPDKALKYLYDALRVIHLLHLSRECPKENYFDNIAYNRFRAAEKKVFGGYGAMYFMYYYLDNMGLTEHGGSVPGWLTDKGYVLLKELKLLVRGWEKNKE